MHNARPTKKEEWKKRKCVSSRNYGACSLVSSILIYIPSAGLQPYNFLELQLVLIAGLCFGQAYLI